MNPYLLGQDARINTPLPNGVTLTETSREIGNNCGDKIDNDKDGKIDSNDEDCDKWKKPTMDALEYLNTVVMRSVTMVWITI